MTVAEIREIINLYDQNHDIIQDDNYCRRVINLLKFITNEENLSQLEGIEELEKDVKINSLLVEILQTDRIIKMSLSDEQLFDIVCQSNTPSRLIEVILPQILDLLRNNQKLPYALSSSIELFEYLYEHEYPLIFKLKLEGVFYNINEEILNKYGKIILEYISQNKIQPHTGWYNSELLMSYII